MNDFIPYYVKILHHFILFGSNWVIILAVKSEMKNVHQTISIYIIIILIKTIHVNSSLHDNI